MTNLARQLYLEISQLEVDNAKKDFQHRNYYGASQLGKSCDREMFLSFRQAEPIPHELSDAETHIEAAKQRLFDRGHLEEDRFLKRLLPFFDTVTPVDPITGKQWAISNLEGFFKGHMDGKATNLKIGGQVYAGIWLLEFKTHGQKSFDNLAGAKHPDGSRAWANSIKDKNPSHYAQAQVYLFGDPELVGCVYIAVCKNTDEWYIEIVERDTALAASELERVRKIIWTEITPPKMPFASRYKNFYCNSFCKFNDVCFGLVEPIRTCKTCDALRVEGAKYICTKDQSELIGLTPCELWKKIRL
jgi:hypothetical protein